MTLCKLLSAGGECGIPFYKRYQMPSEYLKLWYSFDVGPIHNLVFSTELDYSRGSEQFNFILTVSALNLTLSTHPQSYPPYPVRKIQSHNCCCLGAHILR